MLVHPLIEGQKEVVAGAETRVTEKWSRMHGPSNKPIGVISFCRITVKKSSKNTPLTLHFTKIIMHSLKEINLDATYCGSLQETFQLSPGT